MVPKIRVSVNGKEINPETPVTSTCPYCETRYRAPIRQLTIVCKVCEESFDVIGEGDGQLPNVFPGGSQ